MTQGIVKWFNKSKGFGFIAQKEGGPDVFVHHSEIRTSESNTLKEGDQVTFDISLGPKGPAAQKVMII